jgi:hypothetical protein
MWPRATVHSNKNSVPTKKGKVTDIVFYYQ